MVDLVNKILSNILNRFIHIYHIQKIINRFRFLYISQAKLT
jgi:hypothetical protein